MLVCRRLCRLPYPPLRGGEYLPSETVVPVLYGTRDKGSPARRYSHRKRHGLHTVTGAGTLSSCKSSIKCHEWTPLAIIDSFEICYNRESVEMENDAVLTKKQNLFSQA